LLLEVSERRVEERNLLAKWKEEGARHGRITQDDDVVEASLDFDVHIAAGLDTQVSLSSDSRGRYASTTSARSGDASRPGVGDNLVRMQLAARRWRRGGRCGPCER